MSSTENVCFLTPTLQLLRIWLLWQSTMLHRWGGDSKCYKFVQTPVPRSLTQTKLIIEVQNSTWIFFPLQPESPLCYVIGEVMAHRVQLRHQAFTYEGKTITLPRESIPSHGCWGLGWKIQAGWENMKGNKLACIIRNTMSKSWMRGWGCGWCEGGEEDEEKRRREKVPGKAENIAKYVWVLWRVWLGKQWGRIFLGWGLGT